MTSLVLLAAAVFAGLANAPSGRSLTGTVFITTTVVPMPSGPSDAAAADGDAVFMGLGESIVHLDLNVQPPAAVPVADLDADVAALAVDSARVWAGDVRGRLYAFERRPDGVLAAAGSLDIGTGGGAPKVVAQIVIDGPRAFVTMVETGLVIVDAVDGDLRVRGRIDQWDFAPSIGVLDGALYAVIGTALTRIDVHGGGEIERDPITLAFDPDVYHHSSWGPQLLAVDSARRQLVTVGGLVLPLDAGGYILLEPHVAGRVWLPVGWR